MSIDGNGRVTFVGGLAASVGWSRQKMTVMAELVEHGLFRIYRREDIAPHIANLRAQADDLDAELRKQNQAALEDRYRELTLYADSRLQLTKEVASWVGCYPFPATTSHLFAEEFPPGVSVMTLERRASRLALLGLPVYLGP